MKKGDEGQGRGGLLRRLKLPANEEGGRRSGRGGQKVPTDCSPSGQTGAEGHKRSAIAGLCMLSLLAALTTVWIAL